LKCSETEPKLRLGFVVLQPELWVLAASFQTWAGEAAFDPHVDFADATIFALWVEKLVPFKAFTRFLFIVYWHGLLLVGQAFGLCARPFEQSWHEPGGAVFCIPSEYPLFAESKR
jgi:hypothetical protein